ncbi:uncharacterized protein LOC109802343 [Cajanus cajan]|uniref:C2 domain-containing protein n=1 Tax=Cajanus cajan TaxID=3821 RepID=A0A151TBE1_CAJCA|nr:uncharacterized protein LOC109802343 [Cajanus cajan]XP_020219263.1 uncharacterized protein LOC109802343 [Cajanus cajan]KYP64369.1 hypothetical protein KK1_018965 [Cajanus cajan]
MDAATHPRKRTLELTISSLDELREDWKPALKNLYVAVRADSITSYATGTAEDCGGNSSWNETLVVEVPAHARSVTLEVKCRNSPGVKDVGVARIAVTDFLSGAAAGSDECERYLSYALRDWEGRRSGVLNFSVRVKTPLADGTS